MCEVSWEFIYLVVTTREDIMHEQIKQYWLLKEEETAFYLSIMSCHVCICDLNGFWKARTNTLFSDCWAYMMICEMKVVKNFPDESECWRWMLHYQLIKDIDERRGCRSLSLLWEADILKEKLFTYGTGKEPKEFVQSMEEHRGRVLQGQWACGLGPEDRN